MRIEVRFHGRLAEIAGSGQVTLDLPNGSTLREAFDIVSNGRLRPWRGAAADGDSREPVLVFLNSRLEPEEAALRDGDRIDLVVPNIGG